MFGHCNSIENARSLRLDCVNALRCEHGQSGLGTTLVLQNPQRQSIEPWVRANDFRAIALETLVRMKLNAYQRKDQVHLLDLISLGLVDETWLERYPEPLRARLSILLNDPDG